MYIVANQYDPDKWRRPGFGDISRPDVAEGFKRYGWIGEDTKSEWLKPFIVNLASFIYDKRYSILKRQAHNGINIVEYLGIDWLDIRNASGGDWNGYYKCVKIQGPRMTPIVGIAVRATQQYKNHPKFGNRTGTTALVVAVQNEGKCHNVLQLPLDKFVDVFGTDYTIWHNGVMRKKGVKKEDVLDFVKLQATELLRVKGNKEWIELGTLDNSQMISCEQNETKDFIGNLIKYALIRNQYTKYN